MNQALVDRLVNALLYEGYILYPYRPSLKNRQRWTFGAVCPQSYSQAQGEAEAWSVQTECLVAGSESTLVEGMVRFLHLVQRHAGELLPAPGGWPHPGEPTLRVVEALSVDGRTYHTWQEAVEREIPLRGVTLGELAAGARQVDFSAPRSRQVEGLTDSTGQLRGVLIREQEPLAGSVNLWAAPVEGGLFRVRVRVENRTPFAGAGSASRDEALVCSLVSTHTVLGVRGGEFVSLLEPPERWRQAAADCRNVGAWPVLVGEEGQKDAMLSSPIILYDYPQVAPESPGDLFDGTEIDEILTLRILALTDEEKRQAAALDARPRAVLERTESLTPEELMRLHGALRGLRPVAEKEEHDDAVGA
jgi:hydrogenase maturation protease